jgi:anti-sigma factor ChrR (cupin superfamily)
MQYKVTDLRNDGRIAGSVFVQLALAALPRSPTSLESLRARVLGRAGEALAPPGTTTRRATAVHWWRVSPGVEFKVMRTDRKRGTMTAFVRMEAGASFQAHDHPLIEHCFVIEGEIRVGTHRLVRGDLHVAEAGSSHEPTYSEHGALLIVHAALPVEPRRA